jgi:hypothetical protein
VISGYVQRTLRGAQYSAGAVQTQSVLTASLGVRVEASGLVQSIQVAHSNHGGESQVSTSLVLKDV